MAKNEKFANFNEIEHLGGLKRFDIMKHVIYSTFKIWIEFHIALQK